jgi:hypothetical protein
MENYIDKQDLIRFLDNLQQPKMPITKGFKYITIDDAIRVVLERPTADVVEREKIDMAIEEIEQTLYVDSLIFGELIDFKDGKISADDVIEEFNRVTRKEVLEIIKRNVGE